MPRPKKTATSKIATKAKRGRPAKTKVDVKVNKTNKVKATKPKKEINHANALEQSFQNSLNAMTQFWPTQAKTLKKQVADLKVKHKKIVTKQKTATTARAAEKLKQEALSLKTELHTTQDAFVTAKLAADKYTQLNREITQFEKAWKAAQKLKKLESLEEATEAAEKPKGKRGPKPKIKTIEAAKPAARRGRKPKQVVDLEANTDEIEEQEAQFDEDENENENFIDLADELDFEPEAETSELEESELEESII